MRNFLIGWIMSGAFCVILIPFAVDIDMKDNMIEGYDNAYVCQAYPKEITFEAK